jgi:sulfite reductase (ferredoxin)
LASKGVIPPAYLQLQERCGDLGPKDATAEFAYARIEFAKGFIEACRNATEGIGKDLKLKAAVPESPSMQAAAVEADANGTPAQEPSADPVYDLRGVACPMNYVKTKLKLEMMEAGERLEVWLDAGEPIRNVPMSLRNDGHKVLSERPLDPTEAHFKILVEKVEG